MDSNPRFPRKLSQRRDNSSTRPPSTKIISLVPNLRAKPVGPPSKVMMTMTTSTTDPTSPRRYPTPLTSDTPSFSLKELPESSSSIRCCDDDCYDTSPILREFPTTKKTEPNATAVVDPLDDDDDIILSATAQEDPTPAPTLLQEWEAFYIEFKQSITYTLAHSSAASLLPSLIDDDDAEEDRKIHDCPSDQLPPNCSAGLRRLRHSVRELEKVNLQLEKFVASLVTPELHQPTLRACGSNPPYPRPCREPQRDRIPQYAPPMETSPAPHLASPNQNPTQQPGPEPRRDDAPQFVPTTAAGPIGQLQSAPNPTIITDCTQPQHHSQLGATRSNISCIDDGRPVLHGEEAPVATRKENGPV